MMFLKKFFIIIILLSVITTLFMGFSFPNNDNSITEEIDDSENFCIYKSIEHIFETIDSSNFSLCPLYNSENIPQYILAYKDNGGYVIFNRINGNIEEMSLINNTKYLHYTNDYCYYCGPCNYYVKETTNNYYNLLTKESISKQKLESIDNSYKTIRYTKNKQFNNIQEACKSFKSKYKNNRDDITWEDDPFYNNISSSYIEFVNFYDILAGSINLGQFKNNINGSCIFVAESLLLKYYDYVYNDSLVPDNIFTYSNGNFGNCTTIPQSWINYCQGKTIQNWEDPTIYEDMSITPKYTIYEALHNYLACLANITQFGSHGNSMLNYSSELKSCTSFTYSLEEFSSQSQKNNFLQTSIDNDTPIDTFIYLNANEGHATVTYGYAYDNNNNMYFVMHFGWEDGSSIIVPDYYIKNYMYTITNITSTHNVSEQNGVTTYHYACNVNGCFATLNHNYNYMGYYHYCPCGDSYTHTSSDPYYFNGNYYYISYDSPGLGHMANCEICATRKFNCSDELRLITDFSCAVLSSHTPHYVSINSTYHKKECGKCDYVYANNERHTYIFRRCIFCGHHK